MGLYVFLREGRRASLGDVVWPAPEGDEPGDWIGGGETGSIRAYPPEELLWCLDDELWAAELAGDVRREGRAFVGARGRLLSRVETWTAETADALVRAFAFRARDAAAAALVGSGRESEARCLADSLSLAELERVGAEISGSEPDPVSRLAGFAADIALYARQAPDEVRAAAVAAYIAAHALAGGDKTLAGYEARFADERRWQADWLTRRLRL